MGLTWQRKRYMYVTSAELPRFNIDKRFHQLLPALDDTVARNAPAADMSLPGIHGRFSAAGRLVLFHSDINSTSLVKSPILHLPPHSHNHS